MSVSAPQPHPSAEVGVRYGDGKGGHLDRTFRHEPPRDKPPARDRARDVVGQPRRPQRVDTQALKARLAAALGSHGAQYWAALLDFFSGRINRAEFEAIARKCLQFEDVDLHNSLLMGILYNASSDVPLPSTSKRTHASRNGGGLQSLDGTARAQGDLNASDESDAENSVVPRKRLRAMVAGLSKKDRARLKSAGRPPSRPAVSAALGWAGAGADMLERKRKEEERRRTREEKRRVREADTQIGGREWRADAVQDEIAVAEARDTGSLSTGVQQAVSRALVAPLCTEAKELPDMEGLHDAMTLAAVQSGVGGGAAPRAAALLLTALHSHLQNVASGLIGAVRSDRAEGIRTSGLTPVASGKSAKAQGDAAADTMGHSGKATSGRPSDSSSAVPSANEAPESDSTRARYTSALNASSPHLPLRNMPSNLSSRTASTALAASTIADNSTISLASTAPTSHAAEGDSDADAEDDNVHVHHGASESMSRNASNASSSSARSVETALSMATPSSLRLRDLAFTFQLAPQISVESLGQGATARLLNANAMETSTEYNDDSGVVLNGKEQADVADSSTGTDHDGLMRKAIKQAATAKLSDSRALFGSGPAANTPRAKYIADSSATFGLFHKAELVEAHATKSSSMKSKGKRFASQQTSWQDGSRNAGASVPRRPSNGAGTDPQGSALTSGLSGDDARRRMADPMFDVVDAVRLLGPFAD